MNVDETLGEAVLRRQGDFIAPWFNMIKHISMFRALMLCPVLIALRAENQKSAAIMVSSCRYWFWKLSLTGVLSLFTSGAREESYHL